MGRASYTAASSSSSSDYNPVREPNYAFTYSVHTDEHDAKSPSSYGGSGSQAFHQAERRDGETTRGEFSVLLADGRVLVRKKPFYGI